MRSTTQLASRLTPTDMTASASASSGILATAKPVPKREDEAAGEEALPVAGCPLEEVEHRDVGEVAGDERVERAREHRPEREDAPQTQHDARDAREELDRDPSGRETHRGRRSVSANAQPIEFGGATTTAIAEVCRVPAMSGHAP